MNEQSQSPDLRDPVFEVVHTVTDFFDVPRGGIADYLGIPHLYQSEWNESEDNYADTYLLVPVDAETVAMATEDWAIVQRWQTAFQQGRTSVSTHPALPRDRLRHEEIQQLLQSRLVIEPALAVRKAAKFRRRADADWNGLGWAPLEVRWYEPTH